MKKVLITSILILAIISSLLAGTVSYYTTSIDNLAGGSVTAKEFIFASEHEENSFTRDTKIAPGESVKWSFQVMNYKNELVTETDLYYKLTFTLNAADGKQAIEPVEVNIRDSEDGSILATATHSQAKDITGKFLVADKGQAKDYFVEVVWPHGENDSDYAGSSYGSAITVSAIASQVPFDSEVQPVEPEEPEEPGEGESDELPETEYAKDIKIVYETGHSWGAYQYTVRIENTGTETIENWQLSFRLPQTIFLNPWNASITEENGLYTFSRPTEDNNVVIKPGTSINFAGQFSGDVVMEPTDFSFNGLPVNESDISITLGKDKD